MTFPLQKCSENTRKLTWTLLGSLTRIHGWYAIKFPEWLFLCTGYIKKKQVSPECLRQTHSTFTKSLWCQWTWAVWGNKPDIHRSWGEDQWRMPSDKCLWCWWTWCLARLGAKCDWTVMQLEVCIICRLMVLPMSLSDLEWPIISFSSLRQL